MGGLYGRDKTFTIEVPNTLRENKYVQSATLKWQTAQYLMVLCQRIAQERQFGTEDGPKPNKDLRGRCFTCCLRKSKYQTESNVKTGKEYQAFFICLLRLCITRS